MRNIPAPIILVFAFLAFVVYINTLGDEKPEETKTKVTVKEAQAETPAVTVESTPLVSPIVRDPELAKYFLLLLPADAEILEHQSRGRNGKDDWVLFKYKGNKFLLFDGERGNRAITQVQ